VRSSQSKALKLMDSTVCRSWIQMLGAALVRGWTNVYMG
jgi:hypothetical protein